MNWGTEGRGGGRVAPEEAETLGLAQTTQETEFSSEGERKSEDLKEKEQKILLLEEVKDTDCSGEERQRPWSGHWSHS